MATATSLAIQVVAGSADLGEKPTHLLETYVHSGHTPTARRLDWLEASPTRDHDFLSGEEFDAVGAVHV